MLDYVGQREGYYKGKDTLYFFIPLSLEYPSPLFLYPSLKYPSPFYPTSMICKAFSCNKPA